MGSLNTHNMKTLCGTVLRTSSPRIWNYTHSDGETEAGGNFQLSHAAPWHICTAQVITQPQKLHDSCLYQVTGLTCSFVHAMGFQPAGINQLVTHIAFIFPRATGEPAAHNNGCAPLP